MYLDYFSLFVILFVSYMVGYAVARSDVFFGIENKKNKN